VSIDDCDTALATKYGRQLGSEWACANTSIQVLESRYANLFFKYMMHLPYFMAYKVHSFP
jgi:hypothetical protein